MLLIMMGMVEIFLTQDYFKYTYTFSKDKTQELMDLKSFI